MTKIFDAKCFMTEVYLLNHFSNFYANFFPDMDTKYPSCHNAHLLYLFAIRLARVWEKKFDRTVWEQEAVIDADVMGRGEGGGETKEGKNPTWNGTMWRPVDQEWVRRLKLPRSKGLPVSPYK